MTLLVNSAEGGTNGVDVSNANSGGASGTAFTNVSNVSTATEKYSNTQAAHGTTSIFFNGVPGGCEVYWSIPAATSIACRVYVRFNTLPGNCWLLDTGFSGLGNWCLIGVNASHQVYIADLNGTIKTFTNVLTTGVWYRLELEVQIGTTSSNGYIAGRYFLGDATTPAETAFSSSTANTSTASAKISQVDIGLILGGGSAWMDDFAASDGTTTPLGPAVPSPAPFAGWGIPMGTAPAAATATASLSLAATAAAVVTPVAATGTASLSLSATGAAAATVTPATVVTPQRVGRPKGTSWGGGASVTAALPQTPTAGNTLIAVASSYGFASFTATMSTPTGWTAGPARVETGGGTRPALFMFWKLATGSESNPTFNVNGNGASSGQVTITEWRGLDTSAPHLADSAGANVAGTGAQSLTDSITTTTVNEWVFSAIGTNGVNGFGPNANGPVVAWDTPQLPWDFPEQANQTSCAWASGCYPSAGVKTPHVAFTMSGGVSTNIASMSFKVAAGSRPGMAESAWTEYSPAGTSWVATLQTTPNPADVLICTVIHNDAIGAATISGCGATWTAREVHDSAAAIDMHVWIGVNPTSAGPVTVTTANTGVNGKIRVLRASGVGNTATTSYARNSSTVTPFTGPTVIAGPSQLVVALQASNGVGTSETPIASASPPVSNNWMTDIVLRINNLNGTSQDAWLVPPAPGTSCNVTATAAIPRTFPTTMVVVG